MASQKGKNTQQRKDEAAIKFDETITLIATEGMSLRKALSITGLSGSTFDAYVTGSDEVSIARAKRYAHAREKRAEMLFEEMLEIADTPKEGVTTRIDKDGNFITEHSDMLGHRKLQIDTRKWALSKMLPKKYGEKLDVTTDGEALPPTTAPQINIQIVKPEE